MQLQLIYCKLESLLQALKRVLDVYTLVSVKTPKTNTRIGKYVRHLQEEIN